MEDESPVWFDSPRELVENDQLLNFWPTKEQSPAERVNAATRFILYSTLITYSFRRDERVFILTSMVVIGLWVLYSNGAVKGSSMVQAVSGGLDGDGSCRRPTQENPMSNISVTEFGKPSPPPACFYPTVRKEVMDNLDNTIPFDAGRSRSSLPEHQRNAASRQFVTMPVSTVPGAQTEFAEWCYGKKFSPICRSDQSVCSPDARGVQLENLRGLAETGDRR
tara:strand:+ start:98 stop:763 length:666 start_codon:yes stop_codon:yes gene_type:complete